MNKSESINELASALCKAQGEMSGAKKDAQNPFFKSHYADLESVWSAIRKPFAEHGLSVTQTITFTPEIAMLHTILMHSSGQWIESVMPILTKDDSPQAMGSGLSYARRYSLAAIAGVYQQDDDANLAQGKTIAVTGTPYRPQGSFTAKESRTPIASANAEPPPIKKTYQKPSFAKDGPPPFFDQDEEIR